MKDISHVTHGINIQNLVTNVNI